jgi:oligogalacturonide lyase
MTTDLTAPTATAVPMRWPAEWTAPSADPETGATVRQLTNYKAHSHHLYFTNPGWHDGGRRLLFGSDRANRTNLFSMDLASGEFAQLTDLAPPPAPDHVDFLSTCVNPTREEAYFWYRRRLMAVDLRHGGLRELYVAPDGFATNMLNCTADGRYVCTGIYEDLSSRFRVDLGNGYVGFREYFAAHPLSQVVRIATDGSGAEVVFAERQWIGHVNTSPTQPSLLTFCHEGPWEEVDNRIWGLDLATGRVWPIRPRTHPGERVGHEYWLADGIRLGYHGTTADRTPFYGAIRYDNTEQVEASFPGGSTHFHSHDLSLIVGDGSTRDPYVLLWRYENGAFDGPRRLCRHRGSFHVQQLHVHPRLSPDGRQVLFTADPTGYGNLYLAGIPEFERLPAARGDGG